MPQSDTGKHRVLTCQSPVDILGAYTLQVPLGEISRDIDLGFENGNIIAMLDDQKISGYPVDHTLSARQKSRCLVKLEAQSRPNWRPVGLPNEREKIVRRGSLRLSNSPEQCRYRNCRDWSFLAIEIARFAGLKFIDHVRFPTKMDEAKVLHHEMLTQRPHYCLDSLFRVIVAVVKDRLVPKTGKRHNLM